jgi:phosphoribosylaminoimidazole-succinocarboxamide synthase
MSKEIILETRLKDLDLVKRGKVRDIYEVDSYLLIVATDRISAFDVVLDEGVPGKGTVLTQLSIFFSKLVMDIVDNHIVTGDVDEYPEKLKKHRSILEGRSMLVKKTRPLPIECIVRGYLSGSGWKDYQKSGEVCGIDLKKGYKESDKLDEVIFTPSTKAEAGHDINITLSLAKTFVTACIIEEAEDKSKKIYLKGHDYLKTKGIILADTKLEFGLDESNKLLLIDEVLTPDSSRIWSLESYSPGKGQSSYDKQYVRDYLENTGWDKNPPAPKLPNEVIENTSKKYMDIYKIITGKLLPGF